jgi:hypothetical protein
MIQMMILMAKEKNKSLGTFESRAASFTFGVLSLYQIIFILQYT